MMAGLLVTLMLLQGAPSSAKAPEGKPPADPLAFNRRATLDLLGRLPTADEARAAGKKPDPARRVEELLASTDAALYHADLWMQWLLDWDFDNRDFRRFKATELHDWLRAGFDRPFAETVAALIARRGPAANFAKKHLEGGEPPVKLSVLSARLFLGRDVRCAQCHDHPSEKLSHGQFWAWTAFFGTGGGGIRDHLGEKRVPAATLDGRSPAEGEDALAFLAGAVDFRPAVADRYWRLLMGRPGHPVELERAETPKAMLRAIAAHPEYRAREGPLKLMNPVQFMNAFASVFDLEEAHRLMAEKAMKSEKVMEMFKEEQVLRLFFHKWARDMLLPRGQNPEDVAAGGTVRLALKLMNNDKVVKYYSAGWGTVRKVLAKRSRAADRVDEMFLAVLGRLPSADERELMTPKDPLFGFEDLFWALVNSAEFVFVS